MENICDRLEILYDGYLLRDSKYISSADVAYRVLILPCILRYHNIDGSKFNAPPFYILRKPFATEDEFYLYFIRKIREIRRAP
jgi:hypothetical protein